MVSLYSAGSIPISFLIFYFESKGMHDYPHKPPNY